MNFQSAVFVNLAFVFLGAFLGSLLCILCAKAFKRKCYSFRLSLCFLLLSAAIVFFVLFVIKEKADFAQNFFLHLNESLLIISLYFFAGLLCAASLKVFFPVISVLYIIWTLSFGIFLYKNLPLPQKYTLTVSESFARDEESGKEWKLSSESKKTVVDFSVCQMNKNALFPLPRFWHSFDGARPASQNPSAKPFFFEDSSFAKSSGFLPKIQRLYAWAAKKLLGRPKVYSLELPQQALYPVIFEVKVNSRGGNFLASVEKIM
ncbi:MAG: hypothetical protein K6A42_11980 [Treponema sp.]|nr:hypothetical protein [Treponema sp.]